MENTSIIISNLSPKATEETLKHLFDQNGNIIKVLVNTDIIDH